MSRDLSCTSWHYSISSKFGYPPKPRFPLSLSLSWQVEGKPADNLTQPEVVQLLRQSEGSVTVLISRQEVIEKREEEVRGSRYMYMYIHTLFSDCKSSMV